MSLEMETLDQLIGGDMPLAVIRRLYADDQHFAKAIHGLLLSGDVRLRAPDGGDIPQWRWRELFIAGAVFREMPDLRLAITSQGAQRLG